LVDARCQHNFNVEPEFIPNVYYRQVLPALDLAFLPYSLPGLRGTTTLAFEDISPIDIESIEHLGGIEDATFTAEGGASFAGSDVEEQRI